MEYLEIILLAEKLAESNPDNVEGKRFLRKFYRLGITDDVVQMANQFVIYLHQIDLYGSSIIIFG